MKPVAFAPRITRAQFLDRTDTDDAGFTAQQLAELGAYVQMRVDIKGFRDVPLTLRRELIDVRTGDEVGESSSITITPPVDEIGREWSDWIPLRGRSGTYYAIIKLLAPGEPAPLASVQTKQFPGEPSQR